MMAYLAKLQVQLPLAQREAWESLGNRFSGEHAKFNAGDLWAMFGVLLAGVALVWLLRWLYGKQQARRLSNQPQHLFADLCRAHRLSRRDRKRLVLLAEALDVEPVATLFVRPDLFATEQLFRVDAVDVAAYERIARRLFAGLTQSEASMVQAEVPSEKELPAVVVPVGTSSANAMEAPLPR